MIKKKFHKIYTIKKFFIIIFGSDVYIISSKINKY